jgi:hypothetical protein
MGKWTDDKVIEAKSESIEDLNKNIMAINAATKSKVAAVEKKIFRLKIMSCVDLVIIATLLCVLCFKL